MEIDLGNFFYCLHQVCGVLSIVLFQHPSPLSSDKSGDYQVYASRLCITALGDGIIDSIHLVYDVHDSPTKTSLKGNALAKSAMSTCTQDQPRHIVVSWSSVILPPESETVNHPVFGFTTRYGWLYAKAGTEMSFSITKHN